MMQMDLEPINSLIDEYTHIQDYLFRNGQASFAADVQTYYKKILLLSCASLYETYFSLCIQDLINRKSGHESLSIFLYNKGIDGQYYKFFDWKEAGGNVNKFLKLWGPDVFSKVQQDIDKNTVYQEGMESFIKIGHNRNLLVHENFLVFNLEKTFEEIKTLHLAASSFLSFLMADLDKHI
jgi:hypothetical protein